jgi:hypothetical protein
VRTTHPQDARAYNANGGNPNVVGNVTARQSWGRKEPFAEQTEVGQLLVQPNQPMNTFFQHNYEQNAPPNNGSNSNTLNIPFHWLTHLDRQVSSPLELLEVSAFAPALLTRYFTNNAGTTYFQHLAQWTNQNNRLYRFFETVTAAPLAGSGVSLGGRIPGKVNLNTIWDQGILLALADAQQGNSFAYNGSAYTADTEVINAFNRMMVRRTPGRNTAPFFGPPDLTLANALGIQPDRPFWGFGVGPAPGGDTLSSDQRGIHQTLLSPRAVGGAINSLRLFEAASPGTAGHPYQRHELMAKLFNNVTTRSNVFAVWVTVGFFEVLDDTRRPVLLGAEIGRAEGTNVRHRFFAIVDRTRMRAFNGTLANAITIPANSTSRTITLSVQGTSLATGNSYTVPDGAILTVEPDTNNEETVVVSGGQATFYRAHASGVAVTGYGNPGPWTKYNPRQDPCVLYFAVID